MKKIWRIIAAALIFCMITGSFTFAYADEMTAGSVFSKGGLRYRVVASGEVNVYMLHDFSLQDVVIPASVNCNGTEYKVTGISDSAFTDCKSIRSVVISEGITYMGEEAFRRCDNLKRISIPSTLKSFTAEGLMALEEITLAEGNIAFTLKDGALFTNDMKNILLYPACRSGKSFAVPEGVTEIRQNCFYSNQNLESILLPESLETIGDGAFYECHKLRSISVPENVSYIDKYNFYGCESLESISFAGSGRVGKDVISHCENLKQIEITGPVQLLSSYNDIYDTPALEAVNASGDSIYHSEGGILYYKNQLTMYPAGKEGSVFVVPERINYIQSQAFNHCSHLKTVILPEKVTLDYMAFHYPAEGPVDIYFGGDNIAMGANVSAYFPQVFVGLDEGSNLFVKDEDVKKRLSAVNMIEPAGSVNISVKAVPGEYQPSEGNNNENTGKEEAKEPEGDISVPESIETPQQPSEGSQEPVSKEEAVKSIESIDVSLDYSKVEYTGKANKPAVIISGLIEGKDYKVTYIDNVNPGTATAVIEGIGEYKGVILKDFIITPVTSKVSAKLYKYNGAKVSWNKVKGASSYAIYLKNSAGSYILKGRTKGTEYRLDNLAAGKKYTVKIVPCVTSKDGKLHFSDGEEVSVHTLSRPSKPAVRKTSGKIRISWNSVDSVSGYEISKSAKKTGTNVIADRLSGTGKTFSANKNKKYYYKVRAYKMVDGKKIYTPWSKAVLR